jgi:elongation factor Ts
MAYTAKDVQRLRAETDAPLMECKAALEEADGDFEKAKAILREKGKAAAAKRADRSTAAGVVAFSTSEDKRTVAGVVVESETDFVAKNEEFIAIAQKIADVVRDGYTQGEDVMNASSNGHTVRDLVEEAVAKIRENIRVAKTAKVTADEPIATYVHHDRTKGSAVLGKGNVDARRRVAIQVVSNPPEVVSKDQLSQEKLDAEIETETRRAMNEGKDEKIARNIATGRVNKEFVKKAVLLEQPFYMDNSKTVGQYLQEEAKDAQVEDFVYLAVGMSQ